MFSIPPYIYVLAFCFLVSLLIYRGSPGSERYLRFFSPYLLLVLAVETYATYLASEGQRNAHILNLLSVAELCFYMFVLKFIITNKKAKRIITVLLFVYPLVALINIFFIQKLYTVHTVTYSLGCLLIVTGCIFYFLELFFLPKSGKLLANPAFWICFGLLLFYCCSLPLVGLINYWMNTGGFVIRNFFQISNILHIILYASLTIAFLCRIKTRKYTSLPS